MSQMKSRTETMQVYGDEARDFVRRIEEKIEEIEANGGEGITIETSTEQDYGDEYGVLEFNWISPETEQERKERLAAERARKASLLNQLRREAEQHGYTLEKKQ